MRCDIDRSCECVSARYDADCCRCSQIMAEVGGCKETRDASLKNDKQIRWAR